MNSRNGLTALLNSATHRIAERPKHIFLGGLWNIPTTTTSLYLRRLVLEYCYVVTTAHCQMGLKLSLDLLYLIKVSELLAYLRGCRPLLIFLNSCFLLSGLSVFLFVSKVVRLSGVCLPLSLFSYLSSCMLVCVSFCLCICLSLWLELR